MTGLRTLRCILLAALVVEACSGLPSFGQRHTRGAAPPTAPPPPAAPAPAIPFSPFSSSLGPIQFTASSWGTTAPQSLTRQLSSEDEHTRISALAALGAPAQYTARGHAAFPRTLQLELLPLSNSNQTDALVTAELEHHIVTAVLSPANGEWRRVATVLTAVNGGDTVNTPSSFMTTGRLAPDGRRYEVVFHVRQPGPDGSLVENEAHLVLLGGRAVISASFVSESLQCSPPMNGRPSDCGVTFRWLEPDRATRNSVMVTATGILKGKDAAGHLPVSREFALAHTRNFTCQPLLWTEATARLEAAGAASSCSRLPLVPVSTRAR